MVNRIADRILSAVLPHEEAAAPCLYSNVRCYCVGGLIYYKRCRTCTKESTTCTSCSIIGGSC